MDRITKIVNETVDKVLNELSISQKKRNVNDIEKSFRGNLNNRGLNAIRNIAVFTAENPDSQEMPRQFNKNINKTLKNALKDAQYTIIPCRGVFYGNKERPFAVVNISKETASFYCGQFQQTSFVYSEFNNGKVYSEYWEKSDDHAPYDKKNNPYVCKDTCDTWIDQTNADDGYTIVGNKFKYSIPFSIFNEVNERIIKNIRKLLIKENKDITPRNIINEIKFGYERCGYPAYRRRQVCNM